MQMGTANRLKPGSNEGSNPFRTTKLVTNLMSNKVNVYRTMKTKSVCSQLPE